jgi:CubicO group peptidase (beta-lactamase class C family)
MVDFADVDALATSYQRRGGQPGLAYGILIDGELVHAAGLGERHLGGPPPDAGTVFRIASMTKSFTAAAILALRDDGLLKLDDPAEQYVPELRGWPPVTPDSARVSIRHLLTMTAGFPTDDPWGDRQQGLPLEAFASFLSGGVRFNWAPGTRFEYSNLGYAILGRVITAVTDAAYPDHIRHRLLRPLGMTRTGYEAEEFENPGRPDTAAAGLARGYRRANGDGEPGGRWAEVGFDPVGAFAPMGGIFSCVRDLALWVAGFAGAFPPGDSEDGRAHPLRRASRRDMQLPQVLTGWDRPAAFPADPASALSAYGFGLFVEDHPRFGRVVSHSGGYPGFGSNMRWHPASRTGVIALGNGTYAPVATLTARILEAVLGDREPPAYGFAVALAPEACHGDEAAARGDAGASHSEPTASHSEPTASHSEPSVNHSDPRARHSEPNASHGAGPWPETLAARQAVSGLLRSWDDGEATRLFSPNVAQDAPLRERQSDIAAIRERIGDFSDDKSRPPEFDTPAHCRWWLAGPHGVVQAQIQLTPERPPRVQSLTLAVPPASGSPLDGTLKTLVAWMNGTNGGWTSSIPVTESVDAGMLARRLRMAAVWAGQCRPGAYRAGDGAASVVVELVGEHATLTLTLAIDPATAHLRQVGVIA